MARNQVFISYSHKDMRWLTNLETHLKPYTREHSVTASSDKHLVPGSKWFDEITSALKKAKVAVLLVTPDFLASDFIHKHELCPLLKRAEAKGVRILWIPIRACSHRKSAIAKYQAVLEPKKPLAEMKAERDRAWVRVCEAIGDAANPRPLGKENLSKSPVAGRIKPASRSSIEVLPGYDGVCCVKWRAASIAGELRDSQICPIVIRVLSEEPDVEVEPDYDWDWLAKGIRLSDEYFVRVRGSRDA